MKTLGYVMTVLGLAWGIFALNMDVNVTSKAQTIESGGYAINVPSVDVVNIGLMDKRRNHLIFSGFIFLAGVVLIALGKDAVASQSRSCPFCAESINEAAVFCRFCQKEIPVIKRDIEEASPAVAAPKNSNGPATFVHCKKCTAMNDGDATVCFRCQHSLI